VIELEYDLLLERIGSRLLHLRTSQTPHPVVIDMPEHTSGNLGGTQRLGKKRTVFVKEHAAVGFTRLLFGSLANLALWFGALLPGWASIARCAAYWHWSWHWHWDWHRRWCGLWLA
jgi:hypothetical protein